MLRHERIKCFGSLQSFCNAAGNVFRSDMLFEFSLLHQLSGLLACAAQDQSPSGAVHDVRKFLESLQTRSVNRGHVSKPKDNDWRQRRDLRKEFVDFISSAE